MNFQTVAVIILFLAALFYVGRMIYRAAFKKNVGCAGNCKCGIDFDSVTIPKQ